MSNVQVLDTPEDFAETLASNTDVVVEFSAPAWCDPCRKLLPHFEAAADKVSGVRFAYVDIDQMPQLSNDYGIMSVPTILRFRNNEREEVKGRTALQLVNELGA